MSDLKKLKESIVGGGGYDALSVDSDDAIALIFPREKSCMQGFPWKKCILYTLALALGLFLVLTLGSYLWMRHQVIRFTVPSRDYPNPPLSAVHLEKIDEYNLDVLLDKGKLFWDMLRADQVPKEDLVVDEHDFNSLIATSEYLRGHAQVKIRANHFSLDYALPMDAMPGGRHRYLKGSLEITWDEASGRVDVQMIPTTPVPDVDFDTLLHVQLVAHANENGPVLNFETGQFLNKVGEEGWLNGDFNLLDPQHVCHFEPDDHHHSHHHHHHHRDEKPDEDCEHVMATIARIESITAKDGQIVVKPRRTVNNETNILDGDRRLDVEESFSYSPTRQSTLARRTVNAVFPWTRSIF